jgi:hypothetical protein
VRERETFGGKKRGRKRRRVRQRETSKKFKQRERESEREGETLKINKNWEIKSERRGDFKNK